VGYEFVRDTAQLAKEQGLINVVVTNGSINIAILDEILPYIDAFNVDLKAFTKKAYENMGGDLEAVKQFIVKASGSAHVEVTSLIVPGINDSEEEMEQEAIWLSKISHDIVLHITRFFPRYNMLNENPTDIDLMYRLRDIALNHLKYVYLGNI